MGPGSPPVPFHHNRASPRIRTDRNSKLHISGEFIRGSQQNLEMRAQIVGIPIGIGARAIAGHRRRPQQQIGIQSMLRGIVGRRLELVEMVEDQA